MNWLQIDEYKFEVVEDGFKYSGPLKPYQRNDMWSNFSYHTIKIKCPDNIHLVGLRDKIFSDVKYKKDGIEQLAVISNGDMRNAINLLQLTTDRCNEITVDSVSTACDKPPPLLIKGILKYCMENKLKCFFKIN